jgi:hypothetical protein
MKTSKILAILSLAVILFSGCKKDDVTPPSDITINADGSLNISDADGAFYAIQIRNYDTYNSSSYEASQVAYAWFGKFPAIVSGGIVKVNNTELDNIMNYYTAFGFLSFGDTLFTGSNATANWNIQGNAATGIAAFTHTDNAALPTAPAFTLPASININNSLTVNHSSTGGNMGVLYTLIGDNGDTTKFVPNSSSTITFTSAEIKSVAVSGGGAIGLSVMPVSYSNASYGNKKYYFVKQHQFTRETVTQ